MGCEVGKAFQAERTIHANTHKIMECRTVSSRRQGEAREGVVHRGKSQVGYSGCQGRGVGRPQISEGLVYLPEDLGPPPTSLREGKSPGGGLSNGRSRFVFVKGAPRE